MELTNNGKAKGIKVAKAHCSATKKLDTELILLSLDTVMDFTTYRPLGPQKEVFFIKELADSSRFPLKVMPLSRNEDNPSSQPISREIEFRQITTAEVVLATSKMDGVTYAITFPRNLPVTVQVARGMLNNDVNYSNICRISHEEIDLEVVEKLLQADPYAGFCLNTIYIDSSSRLDFLSSEQNKELHEVSVHEIDSTSPEVSQPPPIPPCSQLRETSSSPATSGTESTSAMRKMLPVPSEEVSTAQNDIQQVIIQGRETFNKSSLSDSDDDDDDDGYEKINEVYYHLNAGSKKPAPPKRSTGYCYPKWLPPKTGD